MGTALQGKLQLPADNKHFLLPDVDPTGFRVTACTAVSQAPPAYCGIVASVQIHIHCQQSQNRARIRGCHMISSPGKRAWCWKACTAVS